MNEIGEKLRWGVEQRLEFIEFRLFWEDGLNRSDIVNFFEVSVPQASNDLRLYQRIAPKNVRYDTRLKRYFASDSFKPKLISLDATQYLTQLNSIERGVIGPEEVWIASLPSFAAVSVPRRSINPYHFKKILTAVRNNKPTEIRYQSFSTKDPQWRLISPHAFGFDGMRWHVRAYCHKRERFIDFLLSRILECKDSNETAYDASRDWLWHTEIEVSLVPHPDCSEGQKKAIELDFNMDEAKISPKMRHAMLFYFLKRQGFLEDGKTVLSGCEKPARQQHVVLADVDGVQSNLDEANAV